MKIPLDHLAEGTRLRSADPATVTALVASIRDIGLLNPITVYERPVIHANISVPGWGLVAGLHRLEACRQIGMTEIEAHVVTLGELERQIAECDENLCGPKLTPAQKAFFVVRRKHAYEALHPETRNGSVGAGRPKVRQLGEAVQRFTADTATRTGRSERDIQRDATRGARIDEGVLSDIQGGNLDKGRTLDVLAALPKEQQAGEVKRLREAASKPIDLLGDAVEPDKTDTPPKTNKPAFPRPMPLTAEKAEADLVELIANALHTYENGGHALDRAQRLIDHLKEAGLTRSSLRVALKREFIPARRLADREINGENIRDFRRFIRDAEHNRKMLASSVTHLIQNRLWTNFEMVTERPGSFATLRDMLLGKAIPGLDMEGQIKPIREILSSFPEGKAALVVFEAEFAKGADGQRSVDGEPG